MNIDELLVILTEELTTIERQMKTIDDKELICFNSGRKFEIKSIIKTLKKVSNL